MTRLSVGEITRFARALEAAIADKRRETQADVIFFFDTDVVFDAAFPLHEFRRLYRRTILLHGRSRAKASLAQSVEDWAPRHPLDDVVRALWSAGYTCHAHLLWPHIIELEAAAQREAEHPPPPELLAAIERASLTRVTNAMREPSDSQDARPQVTVKKLRRALGLKEFVLLEALLFDDWERRRQYIGKALTFRGEHGALPSELLDELEVIHLSRIIVQLTEDREQSWLASMRRRRQIEHNALSDAVALVALQRMMAESAARDNPCCYRLYTHTTALRRACDSDWWRESAADALSVPDDAVLRLDVLDDPNGPLRSSQYMFMRTAVPQLGFAEADNSSSISELSDWTLDELDKVVARAKRAVAPRGGDPPALVFFEEVASGSLVHLVTESAMIGFFERVWLDVDGPVAKDMARKSTSILAYSDFVREHKSEMIAALGESQRKVLREREALEVRARQVATVLGQAGTATVGASVDFQFLVGMGVARWLWFVSEESHSRVVGVAQRWFEAHRPGEADVMGEYVRAVRERRIGDAFVSLCIMDAVGQSQLVAAQTERLTGYLKGHLRVAVEILRVKAALSGGGPSDLDGIAEAIDGLQRDLDASTGMPEVTLARAKIAIAWLRFYWVHRTLWTRYEEIPPEASDQPVRTEVGRGLADLRQGRAELDDWSQDAVLAEALELLLRASPGGTTLGFDLGVDVGRWGSSYFLADAAVWADFCRKVREGFNMMYTEDEVSTEVSRYQAFLESVPRRSHEGYWEEHLSNIRAALRGTKQ